jgi:hypothetical protein
MTVEPGSLHSAPKIASCENPRITTALCVSLIYAALLIPTLFNMTVRWLAFLFACCIGARTEYLAEPMPRIATNAVVGRSLFVTTNWLFAGGVVTNTDGSVAKAVVFARPRFGVTKPVQQIGSRVSSTNFGSSLAMAGETLVIKDQAITYFFREENGIWAGDGFIDGGARFTEANGPVAVTTNVLISGMEVYQWPSRKFVRSLNPTIEASHTFSTKAVAAAPRVFAAGIWIAIAFTEGRGVWKYELSGTNWTQAKVTMPSTASARFGEALALVYDDMLVGDPGASLNGVNSGAFYVCRRIGSDLEYSIQKGPAGRVGDDFGLQIVTEPSSFGIPSKAFVSAPMRNEDANRSGGFWMYHPPDDRQFAQAWWEYDHVTVAGLGNDARLGGRLALCNGVVFATAAGTVFAFHPAVRLSNGTIRPSVNGSVSKTPVLALPPNIEATGDLNARWTEYSGSTTNEGSIYEPITNAAARFFRAKVTAF